MERICPLMSVQLNGKILAERQLRIPWYGIQDNPTVSECKSLYKDRIIFDNMNVSVTSGTPLTQGQEKSMPSVSPAISPWMSPLTTGVKYRPQYVTFFNSYLGIFLICRAQEYVEVTLKQELGIRIGLTKLGLQILAHEAVIHKKLCDECIASSTLSS